MSFRSPYPDVEVPDQPLFDYLFGDLGEAAERPALIEGSTGATTSYSALKQRIESLASGLAARGFRPSEVVGMLCPNVPAFTTVFHGILRAGGTATTINSLATVYEIAAQLADAKASHLFTLSAFLPQADEAASSVGLAEENVVVIDGSDTVAPDRTSLASLLGDDPAPARVIDPASQLAVLPYSSGTTGKAKGVMLTHRNLVANLQQSIDLIGVEATDRVLCVLPFFHIYGMNVLMNGGLRQRATLITMPRFELAEFLRIIADHQASFVFIAPPVAVALAKHPLVDAYDLSNLRVIFSGAAPLDGALAQAVEARLGCTVRQGYGMTEMSPVSHCIPLQRADIPLGTVGLTIPNMECKLVDALSGEEIEVPESGTSRQGELWCKGPNVMLGYFGDARSTGEILDPDGYLHTGDVATVSAEGYLTVVDRVKELIKYKGYQVPPAELEALLLTHPDIADAAVIGVRDADGEEIPKAFVVPQPTAKLRADDVIAFVTDRVAPYKKVRQVEFVTAIPKSASGKILRRELRRTP
jgi:acyl-CoA synthetase (AMP-forming)/AMP-acid ligase II